MMTDRELKELRDTLESDCQESDLVCSIQEAGQKLLAHIDAQANQIATLKAALIERYAISELTRWGVFEEWEWEE